MHEHNLTEQETHHFRMLLAQAETIRAQVIGGIGLIVQQQQLPQGQWQLNESATKLVAVTPEAKG